MATLSHRTLPFSAAARACLLACAGSFTLPPHMRLPMRCCHGICFAASCKKEGELNGLSSSSAKAMFSLMMQISDKQKQRYHGFRRVCQVSLLSTRSCLLSSLIRRRPQSLGFLSPSEGRHMASSRGGGEYFFLNKPSRSEGRHRVGGGPIMTKLPSPPLLSLVSVCVREEGDICKGEAGVKSLVSTRTPLVTVMCAEMI